MELQREFIDIEQKGQFSAEQYYDNEGDSELAINKRRHEELAVKLVDLAHAEKGSKR